jgi:mannose-6-phosphate isomerase-like protein (cupin superfamily)
MTGLPRPKNPIPQFITMHLDKSLLKSSSPSGKVQRRRALGPSVFYTPWAYTDHELIQPGGETDTTTYPDMSEAYYVMSGNGSVTVNGETAVIMTAGAIPIDLGQSRSFMAGAEPLELLIIGVAKDMAAKNDFAANPINENPEWP